MTVFSFFIFDRHTECIYSRRWPAATGAQNSTSTPTDSRPVSAQAAPLSNGEVEPSTNGKVRYRRSRTDEAKLVFGVVFSLRNMVRRLGGDDDEFISYRTSDYKLHYYETPTSLKFVMLTDTKTSDLRVVLHQIWVNLYVEFVVRNPLSPVEHPGGEGVNNELFEMGLERFISQVFPPS